MSDGAVRDKTLIEEIESLEISSVVKDRLVKKYWDQVEVNRRDIEGFREQGRKVEEKLSKEISDRNMLIAILMTHIRDRELL